MMSIVVYMLLAAALNYNGMEGMSMKWFTTGMIVALMTLSLVAGAWAGSASATVTDVDGSKITVKVEKGRSALIKKGAIVKVDGGMARVLSVDGDNVTLSVKKSKADGLSRGTSVSMEFSSEGDHLQGC
jgi:hypothetical protein